MSQLNGTGVIYPEIELGGTKYVVKFTRGIIFYRLSKAGVDITKIFQRANFSTLIDVLHAAISPPYVGTAEDLADLVLEEGKGQEAGQVIVNALGKVFPPPQAPAQALEGQAPGPIQ